jgi:hypothetical protein
LNLCQHDPNWFHALLEALQLLLRHSITLIYQAIIIIIFVFITTVTIAADVIVVTVTITTGVIVVRHLAVVLVFKLIEYSRQLFCSIIDNVTLLCFWCLKLAKNTLGDQVEDVGEASGLVGSAGKCINEGGKVLNHLVIVQCIITGHTEYLTGQGMYFHL